MIAIGIDPGASGAVAVIWNDGQVSLYDLSSSHADNVGILREIAETADVEGQWELSCIIEQVHSMPKQGVASSFSFGTTFGVLQGALYALQIPFQLITPARWKQAVFDSSNKGKEQKAQKEAARDLARRLYPQCGDQLKRVKDADRAEALLLAHYAKDKK